MQGVGWHGHQTTSRKVEASGHVAKFIEHDAPHQFACNNSMSFDNVICFVAGVLKCGETGCIIDLRYDFCSIKHLQPMLRSMTAGCNHLP